jgi:hypothetical protein
MKRVKGFCKKEEITRYIKFDDTNLIADTAIPEY